MQPAPAIPAVGHEPNHQRHRCVPWSVYASPTVPVTAAGLASLVIKELTGLWFLIINLTGVLPAQYANVSSV